MKKVLILTTVSGFLSKFEKENVRILQEMGYEVHYAANFKEQNYIFDENELENMGVHTHHIDIEKSPYMLRANRKAFLELVEIIRREQVSLLHCHTPVGGLLGRLAGWACRRQDVKVVYTAHGFHFYKGAPLTERWIYYLAEKHLARFTDSLVTVNEEDYRNAGRFRLKKGGRVYCIPGVGLDMEQFRPFTADEREAARKRLGVGQEDFFLLSVGELNRNKNQHAVLLALNRMRSEGKEIGNIRYGICGDGIYREQMKAWIRELHMEGNAVMYGYCSPIQPVLGCADALIFPSRREGLGMAALEALSMGIPVIAADNRGTREYMEHGKNGYVCRWDDIGGYARGIEQMRSADEKQREALKRYCRQSAMKFEKEHTNLVMRQVYRRLDEMIDR